jgi:hypothetical protein
VNARRIQFVVTVEVGQGGQLGACEARPLTVAEELGPEMAEIIRAIVKDDRSKTYKEALYLVSRKRVKVPRHLVLKLYDLVQALSPREEVFL